MSEISDDTILMKQQLEGESIEEIQIIREARKIEKNKWDEEKSE